MTVAVTLPDHVTRYANRVAVTLSDHVTSYANRVAVTLPDHVTRHANRVAVILSDHVTRHANRVAVTLSDHVTRHANRVAVTLPDHVTRHANRVAVTLSDHVTRHNRVAVTLPDHVTRHANNSGCDACACVERCPPDGQSSSPGVGSNCRLEAADVGRDVREHLTGATGESVADHHFHTARLHLTSQSLARETHDSTSARYGRLVHSDSRLHCYTE